VTVSDLLDRCHKLGGEVILEGNSVRLVAPSPLPTDLVDALRASKPAILALLQRTGPGDALESSLQLGARLKRGEIVAVRCGHDGRMCTTCAGVPCLGSSPWE